MTTINVLGIWHFPRSCIGTVFQPHIIGKVVPSLINRLMELWRLIKALTRQHLHLMQYFGQYLSPELYTWALTIGNIERTVSKSVTKQVTMDDKYLIAMKADAARGEHE